MGLLDDVLYFQFDGTQKNQKTGFADQTWWKTNLIENTWECFSLFFFGKIGLTWNKENNTFLTCWKTNLIENTLE